jgi:hypothetical protein
MPETMEVIAADSAKAISTLAKASSDIAAQLHLGARVRYLVVTVERTSGFVYAPVSNLEGLLGVLNPSYANDLVGSIREEYLFPMSDSGPVRDLCANVRIAPELLPNGNLLVVSINEHGETGNAAVFDSAISKDANASNAVRTYFKDRKDLFTSEDWCARFKLLRKEAGRQLGLGNVFFLLRPEARFVAPTGRRAGTLDLMQMGIAVAAEDVMSTKNVRICSQACLATSAGTLSLLHDKERYYERASRQAAAGLVVKHDDAMEIQKQYDFLEELRHRRALNIPFPVVEKSDPALTTGKFDPDTRTSWYVMPWIQLPKLSDTLLRGGAFKKYELGALMRAAVFHLRQDYWRQADGESVSVTVPYSLWAALLIARKAIRDFTATFQKVLTQLEGDFPVQHSQGVSLHDWEESKTALAVLKETQGLGVQLSWNGRQCFRKNVARPEASLEAFGNALKKLEPGQRAQRPHAKVVHGDVHFLNLLVDSSVPEDPLIISIDPKPLDDHRDRLKEYRTDYEGQVKDNGTLKDSWDKVSGEFEAVKHDPAYDIAKYLLSTACFYGLVRDGLELRLDDSGFFIVENRRRVNKPLSDTGGISTAKLIRLRTGISDRSLWNHLTCADAVVREFVQLSLTQGGENPVFNTNVGLIGLWLLTIRTVFSTARSLFPGDLFGGAMLYLVGAVYMHDSASKILEVLTQQGLQQEDTREILQNALRWEALAQKLERPEGA